MTSSQDDVIFLSFGSLLHFCRRLQAEKSRKKYVEKTIKRRLKTAKKLNQTTDDSSRTKRQSIIIEAKLKIIGNVCHKFYHQLVW